MRVYYDTEFLERGPDYSIDLISIGLVSEGGAELYLINGEAPLESIAKHPWLMENVVPSLPLIVNTEPALVEAFGALEWNEDHPDYHNHVFNRMIIREKLTDFFNDIPNPELWGYCSGYDHVLLAQCWGTMVNMHHKLRYYTNDIAQFALANGLNHRNMPANAGTAHNALDDARWTRDCHEWLEAEMLRLNKVGII